jgi:hypothetical protein
MPRNNTGRKYSEANKEIKIKGMQVHWSPKENGGWKCAAGTDLPGSCTLLIVRTTR